MEYLIEQASDFAALSIQVTDRIRQGWEPAGGVCSFTVVERDGYGTTFHNLWFCQALTRRPGVTSG